MWGSWKISGGKECALKPRPVRLEYPQPYDGMKWEDLSRRMLLGALPKLQDAPRTQRHIENILEKRQKRGLLDV